MSGSGRRVHGIVHGLVQGVNFRAFTARNARRLGVRGWVRNRADGSVEFEAEGSAGAIEEFLASVRTGPPVSEVTDVEVTDLAGNGPSREFDIRF